MTALRRYVFEKGRRSQILQLCNESRCEKLVATMFRNWRGLYFENKIVDQCRRRNLLKKSLIALLQAKTDQQQSRKIAAVCQQHFLEKQLRRVVNCWRERSVKNRRHRVKSKACVMHMTEYRMSRVVKCWFNLVDVLKHEHVLKSDMLRTRVLRLKRHCFVSWLSQFLDSSKRNSRSKKLTKFSKANFARRYFIPWLKLSKARTAKRQAFFRLRARNLAVKVFAALKENLRSSNGERKRARKILLLRAERLIKTAFYDGLLSYFRRRAGSRKRMEVARSHKAERLWSVCFLKWRAYSALR